jgi:lipopolysaccharide transport system permease protein
MTELHPESTSRLTVIRPTRGWRFPDLRELLQRRDLLAFLTVRNIKVRYRQTLLGGAWAIIQPLATMAIMTFVFGKLIGVPSDGAPYWLFSLTSLVVWMFISQTVSAASMSLVNNSQLVEKVYFPRLAIPTAAVIAGLVDLAISFAMLLVIMSVAGHLPGARLPLALLAMLMAAVLCLAVGSALAALSVRYRDVTYIVPLALQLWLFATPIVYPFSLVPARWQQLMALNPATGIVELFRWSILGTNVDLSRSLPLSLSSIAVLLVCGLLIFRRMERSFADVI